MQKLGLVVLGALPLLVGGCRSSSDPPDPTSFGPAEQEQVDPRSIVFHNESVEMAAVEIFAPAAPIKDCRVEAPHRLLCPDDYRHIHDKRIYPRSHAEASYPAKLPLECAQVWLRVHTKAMAPEEFREAIFLLPGKGKRLVLELEGGEAARIDQRGLGAPNRYPAPLRYCDPGAKKTEVGASPPRERVRPDAQVARVLDAARDRLAACCKDGARGCRGQLTLTLALQRDGSVLRATAVEARGKLPRDCLLGALRTLRFPGFTKTITTADVKLKLPLPAAR